MTRVSSWLPVRLATSTSVTRPRTIPNPNPEPVGNERRSMSTTDYDATLWLEEQVRADERLAGAGRCECAPAGAPCRMQPYCAHRTLLEVAVKRVALVSYRAARQLATEASPAERLGWHRTHVVFREYVQVLGTVYTGRPGYDAWRDAFGWPTQSSIPAGPWGDQTGAGGGS